MKLLVLCLLHNSRLRLTRHLGHRVRRMGIRKDQDLKMVRVSVANAATTTLSKRAARNSRRIIIARTRLLVEGVEEAVATGWEEIVDQFLVVPGFLSHLVLEGFQLCLLRSLDLTKMTPWLL